MAPTIMIPSANVYWDKHKRKYLVQHLMPSPMGGSVECNEPLVIEEIEFESRIAQVVLDALDGYSKRQYDSTLERRFRNDREAREFAKRHLVVNVARISGGRLRVSALQRKGSGHAGGIAGGDKLIHGSDARRHLAEAIRDAFQKAI